MCVVIGDVNAFVTDTIRNSSCGEAHVDEQRDMRVSQIMDAYALDIGFLCTSVHFVVEIAFCDGEHPIVRLDIVELFQIVLNFINEELRHLDDTVALFGFGRGNQVLSVQPLIGFCNGNGAFFKIKVSRGKSQKFTFTNTASVQHFKGIER